MGMYFVSNKSQPRSHNRFERRPVTQLTEQSAAEPIAQSVTLLAAQPTSSIITRTRARPNTSRFNMNDTFAARGRPCPRS